MGLDYSYFLYFKRDQLWDALQGVVDFAELHKPPTEIHFPAHKLPIPLDSWLSKGKEVYHNDPEFNFSIVLIFEEDEAILDWGHGQEVEDPYRSPPETNSVNWVSIGYIYLTIYNDLSVRFPQEDPPDDLVLFDFGTTGTRMSMLFYYSTSIRKSFLELLEKTKGVCGVFNKEEEGEVFWLKGKEMVEYIDDSWMLPEDIEKEITK
ncbi:hypothetical protein KA005_10635 [bacterium]|nr:hypothetical protein [bacterium]